MYIDTKINKCFSIYNMLFITNIKLSIHLRVMECKIYI